MIFKKPYAFLIKYFKLINLAIAALTIYLAYRSYNIISFFNEYVAHDYSGNFYQGFANSYISPFLYIIIILIILGISGIVLLFYHKRKPIKAYIISIGYYILFLVFLVILKSVMVSLEASVLTAETARIYRDLSMISIIPQPPFIILFLIRGLGFNLGKFNFKEDIKELEVSEQDSEEVEIKIKQDGVKFKRNIRRFIREFNYYIRENKFIFFIICIILTIALGWGIYNSFPEIVDRNYKQGDNFEIGHLTYRLEDSIITNLDYKGESLGENTYYIVAKLYIKNNSTEKVDIDYNNFRLELNDEFVYPVVDKGINFIDYAENYYGSTIKPNTEQLYSLVFRISDSQVKKNYKLKISNGSVLSDNLTIGRFNYVTITPIVINKITIDSSIVNGNELSFINSNLGNTKLTVSNPIVTDKYIYNYDFCKNEQCNTYKDIVSIDYTRNNKLLIVLDYLYEIDKTVPFYKYSSDIKTFVTTFAKVKYSIDGEVKYGSIKNVTPTNLKNKIVLETTNEIRNAKEIYLTITIRNKEYLVKLK